MTIEMWSVEKVRWLRGFVLSVNQYQSLFSLLFKNDEEFVSYKQKLCRGIKMSTLTRLSPLTLWRNFKSHMTYACLQLSMLVAKILILWTGKTEITSMSCVKLKDGQ